jgi:hypothetical protein
MLLCGRHEDWRSWTEGAEVSRAASRRPGNRGWLSLDHGGLWIANERWQRNRTHWGCSNRRCGLGLPTPSNRGWRRRLLTSVRARPLPRSVPRVRFCRWGVRREALRRLRRERQPLCAARAVHGGLRRAARALRLPPGPRLQTHLRGVRARWGMRRIRPSVRNALLRAGRVLWAAEGLLRRCLPGDRLHLKGEFLPTLARLTGPSPAEHIRATDRNLIQGWRLHSTMASDRHGEEDLSRKLPLRKTTI